MFRDLNLIYQLTKVTSATAEYAELGNLIVFQYSFIL